MTRAPRSILLVTTRQIGDVLLTTPLLRSMRRAFADAVIDVLVYTDKGGMLEGNPDCNEVIAVDEHPDRRGYARLLRRIFRRYELAVTTQANDRSHVYAWLASTRRVGMVPDMRWSSAWKRASCEAFALLDDVATHTVVQNLSIADLLGIAKCFEVVPPEGANAESAIDTVLPWPRGTPCAVLHPFPMWPYKRWTQEGWTDLIRWLRGKGLHVVLSGGPDVEEKAFCGALAKGSDALDLTGRLPFGALPELYRRARLFVGPDTSTTHLAASCGVSTLAIYGPTNPVKWGPWPAEGGGSYDKSPYRMLGRPWQRAGNVILLQGMQPVDLGRCVPCLQEGCERHKRSTSRCLTEMPADPVIAAAGALLASPAAMRSR